LAIASPATDVAMIHASQERRSTLARNVLLNQAPTSSSLSSDDEAWKDATHIRLPRVPDPPTEGANIVGEDELLALGGTNCQRVGAYPHTQDGEGHVVFERLIAEELHDQHPDSSLVECGRDATVRAHYGW